MKNPKQINRTMQCSVGGQRSAAIYCVGQLGQDTSEVLATHLVSLSSGHSLFQPVERQPSTV